MERAHGLAPEDRYVTCAWIAEKWACDQSTVRKLISKGSLPASKLGGMVRVRMADLIAYEKAAAEPPQTPIPKPDVVDEPKVERSVSRRKGAVPPEVLAREMKARLRRG